MNSLGFFLGWCFWVCIFVDVRGQFITFEKTYGGVGLDAGRSVYQTSDEGYIITGITTINSNPFVYLIKTDEYGNEQWFKTFGDTVIANDGWSVQQTFDGGYIVGGYTSVAMFHDIYLIRIDDTGSKLWSKTFGGAGTDDGLSVQQCSDSSYIVAGYTDSFGDSMQVYLVKVDVDGNILWSNNYGGIRNDQGWFVRETFDEGYIVCGQSNSFGTGNDMDIYLLKVDKDGNKQWEKTFGGQNSDYGLCVQQLSDSSYIITGYTLDIFTFETDLLLFKFDKNGDSTWAKTYGGNGWDAGWFVQETSDEGYIITGQTGSFSSSYDVYLLKVDKNGNEQWYKIFGGTQTDFGHTIQKTQDGGYVIVGYTYSFGSGDRDVYLLKTDPNGDVTGIGEKRKSENARIEVYPNPFRESATIRITNTESPTGRDRQGIKNYEIKIYDLLGREVYHSALRSPNSEIVRGNLPAGMYFYKVTDKEKVLAAGKIIIQ